MKDILNRMLNHEELSREEMKNILIGITQSEYPTEQITAESNEGQIMAIKHKTLNVRGIQFHPESVLTPDGKKMLQNWLFL